jgi:hypothetical protein
MGVSVLSIQAQTNKPIEAVRRIAASLSRIDKPAGIIAFASGTLASCLQTLAELARHKLTSVPALFAASDGVFTEQGEVEDQDGLVCLLLGGTRLRIATAQESIAQWFPKPDVVAQGSDPRWPKMLLTTSQWGPPCWSQAQMAAKGGWFGAVTSSDAPLW